MNEVRSNSRLIIAALAAVVAITGAWTASQAWHRFTGQRATATITHCSRTTRGTLYCTGTWTTAGLTHRGHIDQVHNGHIKHVRVRVHGNSAVVADSAGTALFAVAAAVFALALWILLAYCRVAARIRRVLARSP